MKLRTQKGTHALIGFFFLTICSPSLLAAPFPRVYLQTTATVVEPKGGIRLTWTTSNVSRCEARGDWYGPREINGGWNLNWLEKDHQYQLVCFGPGGTASDSVSITIGDPTAGTPPSTPPSTDPAPNPEPEPESPPTQTPPSPPSGSQPWVVLQSSAASVPVGGGIRLTWDSRNVTRCQAGGAWGGQREVDGGWNLNYLARTHTYSLTCTGPAGQTTDSITVYVGESAPGNTPSTGSGSENGSDGSSNPGTGEEESPSTQPTVALSISDTLIDPGGTTRLSWTSDDASYCRATGGPWSGNRGTSGSESSGAIYATTTFTIQCGDGDLTAVSMATVSVREEMTVRWRAPTENTDGTPLTDLAAYRIYYGSSSRSYSDFVEVRNPSATQHSFMIPSGSYLVAMTSLDSEGNESRFSNEVRLSTQ